MKICHFLKCSLLTLIMFTFLIGLVSGNTSEKVTKNKELSSHKNSASTNNNNFNKKKEALKKATSLFTDNKNKDKKGDIKPAPVAHSNNPAHSSQVDRVSTNNANSNTKTNVIATATNLVNSNAANTKNEKTSTWDFFKKTSKSNQSAAGKAFAVFIGGFIMLYLSVVFICQIERGSVVQAEFIDWVNYKTVFVDLTNGEAKTFDSDKAYILEGKYILIILIKYIIIFQHLNKFIIFYLSFYLFVF